LKIEKRRAKALSIGKNFWRYSVYVSPDRKEAGTLWLVIEIRLQLVDYLRHHPQMVSNRELIAMCDCD